MAAVTAPALLRRFGHDVTVLYENLDPKMPDHQADPSVPANMKALQQKVVEAKADIGIALDGDADRIAAYNPLRRVPTLVLDDGAVITDSLAILMALDAMVGPEKASLARGGRDGVDLLRICAFAAGVVRFRVMPAS